MSTFLRPAVRRATRAALAGGVATLALIVSACGTSSSGPALGTIAPTATATVSCPTASTVASWHLVEPGKLAVASDTTYAPAEYIDPNDATKKLGYDMDLIREIARRLCLTADIQTATFGDIIPNLITPALGSGKYDLSISSFTINSDRLQKVDMIPYFTAGESMLVPKGNPLHFAKFDDMCGHIIAVQENTVEQQEIEDANGGNNGSGRTPDCKSNPIKEVHSPDESVVILDVVNGSADASYQDSPVTGYYVSQHPNKLEIGPVTVAPSPEGIVMRKDNPALEAAVTAALAAMRADGTYLRILTGWGQQSGAYPTS